MIQSHIKYKPNFPLKKYKSPYNQGDFHLYWSFLIKIHILRISMLKTSFTFISKRKLTHDVFELIYSCDDLPKEIPLPGQYVMFQLAPGLNRSYSLSGFDHESFTLIIKRIPDGRWSPMICDAEVGSSLQGIIPLGHFTLQNTAKNKCFIGTGTGFAPLYCQLIGAQASKLPIEKIAFVFWVRMFEDSFYEKEIEKLKKDFPHFEYIQYFSRALDCKDRSWKHESRIGYVTDWINHESIASYEEFYICGSPAMVKSARERLEALWITKEQIFWEQF